MPECHLAAVSVLVVLILVVVLVVLIMVVVLIILVVLVLISVLVIHVQLPPNLSCGLTAELACPAFQDLSLGLKIKLVRRPMTIAAVIPPAAAFSPPVKIPRNPFS